MLFAPRRTDERQTVGRKPPVAFAPWCARWRALVSRWQDSLPAGCRPAAQRDCRPAAQCVFSAFARILSGRAEAPGCDSHPGARWRALASRLQDSLPAGCRPAAQWSCRPAAQCDCRPGAQCGFRPSAQRVVLHFPSLPRVFNVQRGLRKHCVFHRVQQYCSAGLLRIKLQFA